MAHGAECGSLSTVIPGTLTPAQLSVCSVHQGHQRAEGESVCVHMPVCDAVLKE